MHNSVLKSILITILFASSFSLYSSGQEENSQKVDLKSGIIDYMEGYVFINDNPAEIGDNVISSDIIRTAESSYCEIVFGELNIFQLEENTVTQINWAKSDINLQKGSISAVFTKLNKFLNDDKDFTLTTPSVTAGVRGTVFFLKVEDDQNTYLCICNGELNVKTSIDDKNISSGHHEAYRFTKKGDSTITNEAPMLYHDDAQMNSVAKKIKYVIPWDENGYNY